MVLKCLSNVSCLRERRCNSKGWGKVPAFRACGGRKDQPQTTCLWLEATLRHRGQKLRKTARSSLIFLAVNLK